MATVSDDPNLGDGPDGDCDVHFDDSDSLSVLSDDSVLPSYEREEKHAGSAETLYEACARNDAWSLRKILERGVTKEEVMELDINGRVRCLVLFSFCIPQGK